MSTTVATGTYTGPMPVRCGLPSGFVVANPGPTYQGASRRLLVVQSHQLRAALALGLIPVVGPFVAAIAGPALGSLMPSIGGAVSDLFDWGDDRIGSAEIVLPAKQMVLLAARTRNSTFNGIGYKLETSLISGSGASYKVYFGIVPA